MINAKDITKILSKPNFLQVNISFLKSLGIISGVYLSVLLSCYKYFIDKKILRIGEPFYVNELYIFKNYNIKIDTQRKCDTKLMALKLIIVKDTEFKKFISFNFNEILEMIEE